jgi:hypothetical protein
MMAEISTPPPAIRPTYQRTYGNRPTGAAIITAIAGLWAMFNGYFVFMIGNYTPIFGYAMIIMGTGALDMVLGLVLLFAGYSAYNMKSSAKGLGIGVNIVMIIINIMFIMGIGLLGLALCVISIIALASYNP